MDIQLVNNAEGVAYYVCSYMCKSEPDELKQALGNLIHSTFKNQPNQSLQQRLWKIGTTVLQHHRMSAQEAAFRVGTMKLVQCTRKIVYLNTRAPSKRFKMLKPRIVLDSLQDNSEDVFQFNLLGLRIRWLILLCIMVSERYKTRSSN